MCLLGATEVYVVSSTVSNTRPVNIAFGKIENCTFQSYLRIPGLTYEEMNIQKAAYDSNNEDSGLFGQCMAKLKKEDINIVAKIYKSIPLVTLQTYPTLSAFFYQVFITLAPDNSDLPIYKAYRLGLVNCDLPANIKSDLSFEIVDKTNIHSTSHSEYYSVAHNLPLLLVQRGVMYRMIRLICDKLRFSDPSMMNVFKSRWMNMFIKHSTRNPLFGCDSEEESKEDVEKL